MRKWFRKVEEKEPVSSSQEDLEKSVLKDEEIRDYKNLVRKELKNPKCSGTKILKLLVEIVNCNQSEKLKDVLQDCKDAFIGYIMRANEAFAQLAYTQLKETNDKDGKCMTEYFSKDDISVIEMTLKEKEMAYAPFK